MVWRATSRKKEQTNGHVNSHTTLELRHLEHPWCLITVDGLQLPLYGMSESVVVDQVSAYLLLQWGALVLVELRGLEGKDR
jgi:hypothetical protein